MLSVCIPIYNYDVQELVEQLISQVNQLDTPIEIICIDDASDSEYRQKNTSINKDFSYIQLEENVGRSSIRNLFLKFVHYPHLLFLDCDSLIIRPQFLEKYLEDIKSNPETVICGGRVYPQACPSDKQSLRWKYGIEKESKPAAERAEHPYRSFLSNNFVTPRLVLEKISFDENLKGYGHEDTLFGNELKENKVPILHIDNPVLNGDVETNAVFLSKSEQAIDSLVQIMNTRTENSSLKDDLRLWRVYEQMRVLLPFISGLFSLFENRIRKNLLGAHPNLKFFDLYKLILLHRKLK